MLSPQTLNIIRNDKVAPYMVSCHEDFVAAVDISVINGYGLRYGNDPKRWNLYTMPSSLFSPIILFINPTKKILTFEKISKEATLIKNEIEVFPIEKYLYINNKKMNFTRFPAPDLPTEI